MKNTSMRRVLSIVVYVYQGFMGTDILAKFSVSDCIAL